jgi:RHS repeat-associated protein
VRRSVDPAGTPPAVIEHYALEGGRRTLALDAASNVKQRYAYAPSGEVLVDQAFAASGAETQLTTPLADHQGSPRILYGGAPNSAPAVRQSVDYAPFGRVTEIRDAAGQVTTSALDAAFGHHGSLVDPKTGLQYKSEGSDGRWYSPDLGRFVSVDPIQDGSNWYAFAGNDPVNQSDPTGLRAEWTDPRNTLSSTHRNLIASQPLTSPGYKLQPTSFDTSLRTSAGPKVNTTQNIGLASTSYTPYSPPATPVFQQALSPTGQAVRNYIEAQRQASAVAAIEARAATQERSVWWAGAGGAVRGLGTGAKSAVNGASSTVVSAATLGFKSYDGPLSVTQYDRDIGYDTANFLHRAAGEIVLGVATGYASTLSKAGTATRFASKTALAYDTTGNVLSVGRGSIDAVQNGPSAGNVAQIFLGGLGVGGNAASGRQALGEILSDAGRVRIQGFGVYSGVPIPRRVYLTQSDELAKRAALADMAYEDALLDLHDAEFYGGAGVIYEVPGSGTSSGLPYIGSTVDLVGRARTARDLRDRTQATVVDRFPIGNESVRRAAEQRAMDARGGIDFLDNQRNEVRKR